MPTQHEVDRLLRTYAPRAILSLLGRHHLLPLPDHRVLEVGSGDTVAGLALGPPTRVVYPILAAVSALRMHRLALPRPPGDGRTLSPHG